MSLLPQHVCVKCGHKSGTCNGQSLHETAAMIKTDLRARLIELCDDKAQLLANDGERMIISVPTLLWAQVCSAVNRMKYGQ